MVALTWRQVHAWRLAQHGLAPRLKDGQPGAAASRISGVQAQVMSAAALGIWSRSEGVSPEAVQTALWEDRTLIKTWAMRWTLHLITAEDLPLFVAARSFHGGRAWDAYFMEYGVPAGGFEAYLAAVPRVLGDEPMTREAFAAAVAKETGIPQLRELIVSANWGSPLKPLAFSGYLCFGPSQGQNVTFVNPRHWLGHWEDIAPEVAFQEMARRYLQVYGPGTHEWFARWWGCGKTEAKAIFKTLADELEAVDVEGTPLLALRSTIPALETAEAVETVRLLPLFDAYTFSLSYDNEVLLAQKHKQHVFRPQGWISAVVLVNGTIQGVWQSKARRGQTLVTVRMFGKTTARVKKGIAAEVERLREFFQTDMALEYEAV